MNFGSFLLHRPLYAVTGFVALLCGLTAHANISANYSEGGTVRLTVTADGTEPFSYQWRKDGVDIPGAQSATYSVVNAAAGDTGGYTASVTNALGSTVSDVAYISVAASAPAVSVTSPGTPATTVPPVVSSSPADPASPATITYAPVTTTASSRLVNVSIRSIPGTGAQTLIVGFVTAGDNKSILVRGVGPGLAPYTASATLADPLLELYDSSGSAPIAVNAQWGGTSVLRGTFDRLGAFALANDSKDTAILATLAPRVYSAQLAGDGQGLAIAEIYDADSAAAPAGRIVNLSARTQVNTGDGVLIAGFVIAGNTPKKLLIRAVGPTLGTYGVAGTLADPKLDLFAAGNPTAIQSNDNWNGTPELSAAFAAAGAFSLADSTSKDAAMVVTLNPGAYSAKVSGVGDTTGVALIEIYELP